MSYALDAGLHGHGMAELAGELLGHQPISLKDVAGTGKSQKSFRHVALDAATSYAAEDADVTLRLHRILAPRLAREGLLSVYERLERPMPPVLAQMECHGIKIDPERLRQLSNDFSMRMAELEAEAQRLVGRPFNLGSPKQIGDVLFGVLGLAGGKKTATGVWSTDAGVLEDLAVQGHALPRVLLDWRQLAKLKGTYTDALALAISPRTGRVHTSFALASTTTGRISSSDPNLQNIPVRTEEGRKIRTAFIAEPGHVLISADYSQIELRILAHIGDIPQLKHAFQENLDIHAMTASEMFGVPVEGMPAETRRRAKAINFGIVYGISAFGLANQLGIPQDEAGAYIRTYFERFPGIKAYMDGARALVRAQGFVTTLFGRKINIPMIRSKSVGERQFAERAAINAPIQGAAADVMRRAMIRMPAALKRAPVSRPACCSRFMTNSSSKPPRRRPTGFAGSPARSWSTPPNQRSASPCPSWWTPAPVGPGTKRTSVFLRARPEQDQEHIHRLVDVGADLGGGEPTQHTPLAAGVDVGKDEVLEPPAHVEDVGRRQLAGVDGLLEELGQPQLAASGPGLVEHPPQFGKTAGLGHHQAMHRQDLVAQKETQQSDPDLDERRPHIGARLDGAIENGVGGAFAGLDHEGGEQLLLGPEVVVERAFRTAEAGGDLRHRGRGITLLQEDLPRHGQDGPPARLAPRRFARELLSDHRHS